MLSQLLSRFAMAFSLCAVFLLSLFSCSDGNSINDQTGVETVTANSNCDGSCASSSTFLSVADVGVIIAQGVSEAIARGEQATIAVVDRVGNVLGVFQMTGASSTVTVSSGSNVIGGLEGVNIVPSTAAAISKAITAAYLSSEGNAFSTRTASQIVQENFNPGELNQASGPLFGVQFSQLPCSDFSARFIVGAGAGPKRSPLGLSADPGGFPLYKSGTVVGGVGVIADGVYGVDKDITNIDKNSDELIAWAATRGFAAPAQRRANRITVAGKSLRFSDVSFADMQSTPPATQYSDIDGGVEGVAVSVNGYFAGGPLSVVSGTRFGVNTSGIRPDSSGDFPGLDAFVVVNDADVERFPRIGGSEGANALLATEVRTILASALELANEARAQIRQPLGSAARVTISVVDSNGVILGVVRSRDAPVFGSDVSVQKARTAAFFSRTGQTTSPADTLRALPDPEYLDGGLTPLASPLVSFASYVSSLQLFLGDNGALEAVGSPVAFSDRAGGNLSRPHFPDGPSVGPAGPLSKQPGEWSVFSTGLQSDLIYNALVQHVGFVAGVAPDVIANCSGNSGLTAGFASVNAVAGLANGVQIFPGSVPIYRNNVLVGGIGVSGDGIDQDDMIAFLGLHRAGQILANGIGNAPKNIRADNLTPQGIRLRYISCPYTPFNGSTQQSVCADL